ncbi:MAG: hypothetical protein KAG28_01030 [Cocleimonas sp.]|nr:hypothetical protein [Cocleimonas sp.]
MIQYTKMMNLGVILSVLFLSSACSHVRYNKVTYDNQRKITKISAIDSGQQKKIEALQRAIMSLGSHIDPNEAYFVAREGVLYPMVLSNQYRLVSPPLLQNVLVNYNYRKNGLCWQWTRDMGKQLGKNPLRTLEFHHGVAFRRNYWKEHSTLVVTKKGDVVKNGIVLDPWRNSGVLYWNFVKKDTKFPWVKFTD